MAAAKRVTIDRGPDPIVVAFKDALSATALEVGNLASRDWYPLVARLAVRELRPWCLNPGLILPTLIPPAPVNVRTFRLGVLLGVLPASSAESFNPIERLRNIETTAARVVRGLAGDLPWANTKHHAERAAMLLRALVAARLSGGAS